MSALRIRSRGCAQPVLPFICQGDSVCHTLIVSPPRCGKTTLLRDMIRLVSNGYEDLPGRPWASWTREVSWQGCWQGIPQNDLGMRTDILDGCPKAEGMQMLLRSMSPAVVAVDELVGRRITVRWNPWCAADASFWPQPTEALSRISWSSLFQKLARERVFERYVLLGKNERAGIVEGIFDRDGKPCFG